MGRSWAMGHLHAQHLLAAQQLWASHLAAFGTAFGTAFDTTFDTAFGADEVDAGNVAFLAMSSEAASRRVQAAIAEAQGAERRRLALGFKGYVIAALKSQHANFVVTQLVRSLPVEDLQFVVEELQAQAKAMAMNRFACRAVVCLVKLHGRTDLVQPLADQLLTDAPSLARNEFGHHVLEAILCHGSYDHRKSVLLSLGEDLVHLATHRRGSYVVQALLRHCCASCCWCCEASETPLRKAVRELMAAADDLFCSQAGCHVLRELRETASRLCLAWHKAVQACIDKAAAVERPCARHGRKILL
jgi:hypothetical protein